MDRAAYVRPTVECSIAHCTAHFRSSKNQLHAADRPSTAPQRTYNFAGHDREVLGAWHVGGAKGVPQYRIGARQAAVLQLGMEGTGKDGGANATKGRKGGSSAVCGLKHWGRLQYCCRSALSMHFS